MKKMTRWGIGPRFAITTILYAAVLYMFNSICCPLLRFDPMNYTGIYLISIGFILFIYPAVTIDKYFNEGKLRTSGLYSIVRHPIYAAWIVLIIPGIVLLSGIVLNVTIPIAAYFIFSKLIHIEEDYLKKKFDNSWYDYRSKVNAIFPKIL